LVITGRCLANIGNERSFARLPYWHGLQPGDPLVNKSVCILGLLLPLCSCTIIPSLAEVGLSSAFSGAVSGAARLTGVRKQYDHSHPRVRVKDICIVWNERVSVPDMLPVIQGSLRQLNIDSHVYASGTEPSECEAVLYYAAMREWDRPMMSDALTPYLSQAQLVLRQRGQVVAQADYDVINTGSVKWSDTEAKVGPLVEALIFGEETVGAKPKAR
jgi:hypothetical protein